MLSFPTPSIWQSGILLAVAVSVLALRVGAGAIVGRTLRRRFVLGVPWGTLVLVGVVLAMYLFVQGGLNDWNRPARLPFSAWSYFYPLGIVTAGISHANPSHLINNLTATLILGPLAEYAYGHYPRDRGAHSFGSWRSNPYVRALVIFPGVVLVLSVFMTLLAWGPVIGFSASVFAFAGFALVRYPILTLVALVARSAIRQLLDAMTTPVYVARGSTQFVEPWWAGISVQGHALGLVVGALLGSLLLWRRNERPDPWKLWLAAVLAGFSLSLWAVWWYRGSDAYVLYRGLGVILVFAFALLIVGGATATDRRLTSRLTRRQASLLLLALPLVLMAAVAVPTNVTVVDADSVPAADGAVEVEDYTIVYAEDVQNQLVSVVSIDAAEETTNVTSSGVIVISEQRHIWMEMVSEQRLASNGRATVVVGGLGWQEVVHAERDGWTPLGGDTAYRVAIGEDRDEMTVTHVSEPTTAELQLDGHELTIVPRDQGYFVELRKNGSVTAIGALPDRGGELELEGITFSRDRGDLVASFDETELTVAVRETP